MKRRQPRGQIDLPASSQPFRELTGGALCLDFVNTAENAGDDQPVDYLFPGYGNLVSWALHAAIVESTAANSLMRAARREPKEAALVRRRVIALREAITAVVTRAATSDHLETITSEWRIATSHRILVADPGTGILNWQWIDAKQLDSLLWPVVASAIDLLTADHGDRLRVCDAPGCTSVFLDTTRNGSRRFCQSQGCGNRTRVRRFRQNRSGETPVATAELTG
jgi:predicted RNA-binding Zn ribbon-like protein